MNRQLKQQIEALNGCKDIGEFKQTFRQLSRFFGFEYFIYNIRIKHPFDKTKYFAIGNYPNEWIQTYESNNYATIDPVIKHCTSHKEAIIWHDILSQTSHQKIINFFNQAKSFHLHDGISRGLRINRDEIGILSLASRDNISSDKAKILFEMIEYLQLHIHHTMMRIAKDMFTIHTPSLTKRESDIVFWLATGETSANAAKILGISEATVVFHMKNIIQKLDANNRTHAIIKAISLNLINIDEYKIRDNQYHW